MELIIIRRFEVFANHIMKKKEEYDGTGEEVSQIKLVHEGRMDSIRMIGRRESG